MRTDSVPVGLQVHQHCPAVHHTDDEAETGGTHTEAKRTTQKVILAFVLLVLEREREGTNGVYARSQLRGSQLRGGLVSALNESTAGSVKSVFKPWEHRLNSSEGFLESNDGDPELLVFIPFTSDVKLKSISIVGGADGTSPSKMRAFINRDGIDFSDAQTMQPVQVIGRSIMVYY
ncbi:hypothetical protein Taro_027531 [Colocasia esculenta]|uniref:PITH domain-containing protein n=1 Tax=Colocasia esculenta TaxID=4460 RepID=A0A843VRT4_COLES|nr:hypothetical protein [Colocasia esculenta]